MADIHSLIFIQTTAFFKILAVNFLLSISLQQHRENDFVYVEQMADIHSLIFIKTKTLFKILAVVFFTRYFSTTA